VRFWTLAIVAGCLAAIWWSVTRWHRAETEADRAERLHQAIAADVGEVTRLEASRETVSLQERPPQDVIALVNAVLAEVGLRELHLKRLTAESDAALPRQAGDSGPEFRRQSVRLVLQGMTMPELGQFLARWRTQHPVWTPARLELAHPQGRRVRDGEYEVTIVLSAAYVADRGDPT